MASVLNKFPFQGYGPDQGLLRGTVNGNGSTTSSGSPRIDLQFPVSKPPGSNAPPTQPQRFQLYQAYHDATFTGVYDILLASDFADILPTVSVEQRVAWLPATVFVPVTSTTGDGVLLIANTPNQAQLQVVITISGGTGTVASGAISNGVLTFTMGSATTMATFVTYVNAHSSTVKCTAAIQTGPSGDFMTGSAASAGLFFTGQQVWNGAQATAFIASSSGAPDGITFTAAAQGSLGNGVQIIINTGAGSLSTAVQGNVITVTLASSGSTNEAIANSIVASSAAAALVTVAINTPGDAMTAAGGAVLTGGGHTDLQILGPVDPSALQDNGLSSPVFSFANISVTNLSFFHFRIQHTAGGVAVDQSGTSTMFLPSTTRGDGLILTSGTGTPVAATGTVASTTGGDGVLFTAVAAGSAGNLIGIVYNGPAASYFLPSTTSGDGIMFTAATNGSLGTAVSVFSAPPSGSTSYCVVNGNAILLYPKVGETNTGLDTVINAVSAATALVSVAATGGTDVVSSAGNGKAVFLSGGNTNGSNTATVSVTPNAAGGQTIIVNFGASTTNATVTIAVNTTGSASAALVTASNVGTSTDHVLATTTQYLTGGTSPTDLTVQVVLGASASPSAAMSGNALTISLGTTNTNNTNLKLAAAVNEAQASTNPLILAAWLGSSADVFVKGFTLSPTRMLLGSLMEFVVLTKENALSLL